MPRPPALPTGRRCWGRTPCLLPGIGAASGHRTPWLGLSVAPGLRMQRANSVPSTASLPRGPAGKGHQLFCPWPGPLGQALGRVLCGPDPQATATLPERLALYVSSRFFWGATQWPWGWLPSSLQMHTEAALQVAAAEGTGGLLLRPTPPRAHSPRAVSESGGEALGPSAGVGARPPSPTPLSPLGRRGTESADKHWPRIWEVPHVAPKELGHVTGQAGGVAGPQGHAVMLCLPPGIYRGPPEPCAGLGHTWPSGVLGLSMVLGRVRTLCGEASLGTH